MTGLVKIPILHNKIAGFWVFHGKLHSVSDFYSFYIQKIANFFPKVEYFGGFLLAQNLANLAVKSSRDSISHSNLISREICEIPATLIKTEKAI